MMLVPLSRLDERLRLDKADSDSAYFQSLLYSNEFLIKWVVAEFVAAIGDDKERNRYRIEHVLLHADGIGEWATSLQKLFTGPAFVSLDDQAKAWVKLFTEKVKNGDWRYSVCANFNKATRLLGSCDELAVKVSLVSWVASFSYIRNKTRGHGAISANTVRSLINLLEEAYFQLKENLPLLNVPCAYLRQNLSGKYRVSVVGGDGTRFDYLRGAVGEQYPDGIYFALTTFRLARLIESDPDLLDFYIANGSFNDKTYDVLSYQTGSVKRLDSSEYLKPVDALPGSETKGTGTFDVVGNVFTNMPVDPNVYIHRAEFEETLRRELIFVDRHTIVTIDGRGGIGKTSSALHVINEVAKEGSCPYDCIAWFSARDIDLTVSGVKSVQPEGVKLDDFANRYFELVTGERAQNNEKARAFLSKAMGASSSFKTLFVFDNFETVDAPVELFHWIDEFVRPPNKVLITTRIRRFKADFPIHLQGMKDKECEALIKSVANRLSIEGLLTPSLVRQFSDESGGHPYVIKIMLGELAKHRDVRKVERVMASRDDVLTALFERTYSMLTPAAQRIFLTISSWRSIVSELAVEAVLIRPTNDLIDARRAIDELLDFSFVDVVVSKSDEEFLSVPLAAQVFGRSKVTMSPYRGTILEDLELLRQFGVTRKSDLGGSVENRLRILFRNISSTIASRKYTLESFRPIIEYVARKHPQAWLYLADLCRGDVNRETRYLMQYLENEGRNDVQAWWRIVRIFERQKRSREELNALSQLVRAKNVSIYDISEAANRANFIATKNGDEVDSADKKLFMSELAYAMKGREDECTATDLSRLAWIHLKLKNRVQAVKLVKMGLEKTPDNKHCLRLKESLGNEFSWG